MSIGEVKSLYPEAQTGSKRVANGAIEELRLAHSIIAERRFSIGFWFANGGLDRVVLEAEEIDGASSNSNAATFAKLVGLLGAKYGGSNCQTARGATLLQGCEWETPETRIDLIHVDLGDLPILLDIYYQARRAGEGDRHRGSDGDRL
jgi:hypothetical protein